ncbi:MAG: DUF711 family protein [Terriglobia bacterium]
MSPAVAAPRSLKVRTVTAFIPFDPATAETTLAEAADFLEQARTRLHEAGFEVQTVRLATPPLAGYRNRILVAEQLDFLLRLDRWATERSIAVSLGPLLTEDRFDPADALFAVDLLRRSRSLHTSVVIGTGDGPRPQAIRAAAEIIRRLGRALSDEPLGFRFAALAACPPGIPFFPAAYAAGDRRAFALGLESAGVFAQALRGDADLATKRVRLRAALEGPLQQIESVALSLARETGWAYRGIDTSPAPSGAASIGAAVEALAGQPLGSSGTLAAVSTLTGFIQTLPVERTGFSGLMLPVLEDNVLARRAAEGRLTLQLLLAYSAVSGTGLDVIPLPGNTSLEQLERVLGDVAALAARLRKPLTARLLLVPGRRAGEQTEFNSPWLTNTKVLPLE